MFFGGLTIAINGFSIFFFILLPSLLMVFDGSGPLVKRCDGFDGSLWSSSRSVAVGFRLVCIGSVDVESGSVVVGSGFVICLCGNYSQGIGVFVWE